MHTSSQASEQACPQAHKRQLSKTGAQQEIGEWAEEDDTDIQTSLLEIEEIEETVSFQMFEAGC